MKFLSEVNRKAWNIIIRTNRIKGKVSKTIFKKNWKKAFSESLIKVKCQMQHVNVNFFNMLVAFYTKTGYNNLKGGLNECYSFCLRAIRTFNNGVVKYYNKKNQVIETMTTWWEFNATDLTFKFWDKIELKMIKIEFTDLIISSKYELI
jgi:hypothetical protein